MFTLTFVFTNTHGSRYGAQPLYDVEVSVASAGGASAGGASVTVTRRVGFRSVNMESTPANATTPERHIYRVNGVPIYAKGANWVPPDSLQVLAPGPLLCSAPHRHISTRVFPLTYLHPSNTHTQYTPEAASGSPLFCSVPH
jgi:hypothetical protein